MMSALTDLGVAVYAPPLLHGDERPLAIIHGMERALPGLRLGWTASGKEDLIPLPYRDEWVAAKSTDGGFPFLCNDDDDHLVTLAGSENPNGLAAGSPPHFEVRATLLLDVSGIVAAVDVLEAVAEGARAFWGHATPFNAAVEIAEQTSPTLEGPPRPPRQRAGSSYRRPAAPFTPGKRHGDLLKPLHARSTSVQPTRPARGCPALLFTSPSRPRTTAP
jgi:hypothetical protein